MVAGQSDIAGPSDVSTLSLSRLLYGLHYPFSSMRNKKRHLQRHPAGGACLLMPARRERLCTLREDCRGRVLGLHPRASQAPYQLYDTPPAHREQAFPLLHPGLAPYCFLYKTAFYTVSTWKIRAKKGA